MSLTCQWTNCCAKLIVKCGEYHPAGQEESIQAEQWSSLDCRHLLTMPIGPEPPPPIKPPGAMEPPGMPIWPPIMPPGGPAGCMTDRHVSKIGHQETG